MNVKTLTSMEEVQLMIKSGTLRVKSHHGVSSVVEMAIHEDIYQKLILKDGGVSKFNWEEKINFDDRVQELFDKYITTPNKTGSLIISKYDQFMLDLLLDSIPEKTDESIKEAKAKYNKQLKYYGNYDKDDDRNEQRHTTLTNFKRDIQNSAFPREILKGSVGSLWTSQWFQSNNMQFHTPLSTNDESSYHIHQKRLNDILKITSSLKNKYDEYSEHLSLKIKSSFVLEKEDVENIVFDFYGKESAELKELYVLINKIVENKIKGFSIGDESEFDQFCQKLELFKPSTDGTYVELLF